VWAAGWTYYVVSLFPVLGIVQVGGQAAADRYTYMSSLGPFLFVGIGVAFLREFALKRWSCEINEETGKRCSLTVKVKTTLIIPFLIVISVLSALTIQQERVWKDSFALWSTELKKFPRVSIAYRNLGAAYGVEDNYKEALKNFNRSIDLNPFDPLSFYNRGIIHGKSGLNDKAIEDLQKAIRLDPLNAKFYNNLGVAYGISGNLQEAITSFDEAVQLDPSFSNAYFHRAVTYIRLGFTENALRDLKVAAQLGDTNAQKYLLTRGVRW
jgi:tetratricopeptide (TPR) repeat protein